MTPHNPDEPVDAAHVDDPHRVGALDAGSPHYVDPETGYFGFCHLRARHL